jgi:hypothetical protein
VRKTIDAPQVVRLHLTEALPAGTEITVRFPVRVVLCSDPKCKEEHIHETR